nr:ribonuclease H-like domain-containing protein [Tanacetum cinerariifolium]
MVLSVNLPILKKGEYIIWTMKIEQYLANTDYALWEVILNGNGKVQMTKYEVDNEVEVTPITTQQILARTRERKAKSTLLMAILDEHLARFHGIKDAKTLWAAIKNRFSEGLDKGYDRFQRLLSLLEIHEAESTSSTNELNDAYSVSTATSHSFKAQGKLGESWSLMEKNQLVLTKLRGRDAGNAGYKERDNGKRHAREKGEKALVVQDGLGYHSQFNEKEVLDVKEEKVTETVFDNHSSDEENSLANDRFKKGEGFHVVPPPLTRNYMPPKPDLSFASLDDSIYKFKISETVTSLSKDVKDAPETSTTFVEKPKVRTNKMAKKSVSPNNVGKGTGHRESRPVWNNVQRINHQNKFAPIAISIRPGRIPVSAAKLKAAASTISVVKGNGITGVKASAGCVWRPRVNEIDQISKDNRWIYTRVDYGHPQQALENKGIVNSGCSRHMKRNKAYLVDYQKINDGGFVSFGSSRGKFKGKADEGFLVGYSITSKAFRVFNTKTKKVEENLHVGFLENKPNVARTGHNWLFDIDSLTNSMSYIPVSARNQTDKNAGPQDTNGNVEDKAEDDKPKDDTGSKTIVEPMEPKKVAQALNDESWVEAMQDELLQFSSQKEDQAYKDELDRLTSQENKASDAADSLSKEFEQGCMDQRGAVKAGSTNSFNTVSNTVNAASTSGTFSAGGPSSPHLDVFIPDDTLLHVDQDDSKIPDLEDTAELGSTGIFTSTYDDDLYTFTSLI